MWYQLISQVHFSYCFWVWSTSKQEMMKVSLSWQLHLVRTYLADVSTRCSSPPQGEYYFALRRTSWNIGKISSYCVQLSRKRNFRDFMSTGATVLEAVNEAMNEWCFHWITFYYSTNAFTIIQTNYDLSYMKLHLCLSIATTKLQELGKREAMNKIQN